MLTARPRSVSLKDQRMFDVAIVGSGPAGASCAGFCAMAGMRTLLLEREKFPREKVCGDCLNPSCTPVLERLGITNEIRALPHGKLQRVDFIAIGGHTISVDLPRDAEIAIKRSLFDQCSCSARARAGAEDPRRCSALTSVEPKRRLDDQSGQRINHSASTRRGRRTQFHRRAVARTCCRGSRKNASRCKRICRCRKISASASSCSFCRKVIPVRRRSVMSELNLCLVGKPKIDAGAARLGGSEIRRSDRITLGEQSHRCAAKRFRRRNKNLFFVGDAARVVEPFTGEGIFYALRSGELAAEAICERIATITRAAHEKLYRGRLWINRIARTAVLSPRVTSLLLRSGMMNRKILRRAYNEDRNCRQALTVFAISIAIVIGPTPPGTGVIAARFLRDFLKGDIAD